MLQKVRLVGITAALFVLAVVSALTATQGFLPKYDAAGALIDSQIYDSGTNVGIGTNNPVRQLTLNHPTAAVLGLYTNGSERVLLKGLPEGLVIDVAGNERARMTGVGLGIGLTTPASKLHLAGGGLVFERYLGDVDPTNAQGSIWVKHDALNNYEAMVFRATAYQFQKDDGTTYLTALDGGNVGIGTASPTAKLHVAGNVTVDGNIGAKYQDVAEWVQAAELLSPGTVVVADTVNSNHVTSSRTRYDTAVAGVVSRQPGIILGERAVGAVAVAQSGRVKVKVDAKYGAIQRGDLLVSSPTKGHAMRSTALLLHGSPIHRPGTILGKALEPLSEGAGEILALITLQ